MARGVRRVYTWDFLPYNLKHEIVSFGLERMVRRGEFSTLTILKFYVWIFHISNKQRNLASLQNFFLCIHFSSGYVCCSHPSAFHSHPFSFYVCVRVWVSEFTFFCSFNLSLYINELWIVLVLPWRRVEYVMLRMTMKNEIIWGFVASWGRCWGVSHLRFLNWFLFYGV